MSAAGVPILLSSVERPLQRIAAANRADNDRAWAAAAKTEPVEMAITAKPLAIQIIVRFLHI
jgi:antitoxin (DNA-binding transcriptional repressor) of toxin-antitoxin stability system